MGAANSRPPDVSASFVVPLDASVCIVALGQTEETLNLGWILVLILSFWGRFPRNWGGHGRGGSGRELEFSQLLCDGCSYLRAEIFNRTDAMGASGLIACLLGSFCNIEHDFHVLAP